MKKETLVRGYQLPGIPDLFCEAFSDCEQHHKALKEEKKLSGLEQLTWMGFCSLEPQKSANCTNYWAIQQCKSHPSKTALSGHISTSYLPCMQLQYLRM